MKLIKNKNLQNSITTKKVELIKKLKKMKVVDLCKALNMSTSTFYTRLETHKWHETETAIIDILYRKLCQSGF